MKFTGNLLSELPEGILGDFSGSYLCVIPILGISSFLWSHSSLFCGYCRIVDFSFNKISSLRRDLFNATIFAVYGYALPTFVSFFLFDPSKP